MIPMYQTIPGCPDGNCWEAAICSVLEIEDIREIPRREDPAERFDAVCSWLSARGIQMITVEHAFSRRLVPADEYYVLNGVSTQNRNPHSVVAFESAIVHNPNRKGTLDELLYWDSWFVLRRDGDTDVELVDWRGIIPYAPFDAEHYEERMEKHAKLSDRVNGGTQKGEPGRT